MAYVLKDILLIEYTTADGLPTGNLVVNTIARNIDNGDLFIWDNTSWIVYELMPAGGGGGLTKIQDDTNPILGGNLDASTYDISNIVNLTSTNVTVTGSIGGDSGVLDFGGNDISNIQNITTSNITIQGFISGTSGIVDYGGSDIYNVQNTNTINLNVTGSFTGTAGNIDFANESLFNVDNITSNRLTPGDGATGSFTTSDGKTITVTSGIITGIV